MSPTTQGAVVLVVTLVDAGLRDSRRLWTWRDLDHLSADLPGLQQHACGRRDLLFRPRRIHAGRDPDVRDDGRGHRLLAGRQGSLRGARPLALPASRRAGDFQSRRLRDLSRRSPVPRPPVAPPSARWAFRRCAAAAIRTKSRPARSAPAARSAFSFRRRSPSFSTASPPRPRSGGCSSPASFRAPC